MDSVFDRSGYLFEEPENLLKQELREPGVYNSIITAIAEGASKLNEISTKIGTENAACSKYIKVLIDLGIITRETPITEKPGKKTLYIIEDHFFRFWYRFIPQNYSMILSGRFPRSYERVVKAKMHDYMGLIFEKMCKEYYATVFGKGTKYDYVIFSLGGFTNELLSVAKDRKVMLLTLDDIYGLKGSGPMKKK